MEYWSFAIIRDGELLTIPRLLLVMTLLKLSAFNMDFPVKVLIFCKNCFRIVVIDPLLDPLYI